MSADFDYTFYRVRQDYDVVNYDSSDIGLRFVVYNADAIHDFVIALIGTADKNGTKDLFTGYDTTAAQWSDPNYMGMKFSGADDWPAANAPYLLAFYYDIRDMNMSSAYMDSVVEAVQDIEALSMESGGGTRVTSSEGDLNGDGFNEAEGAYVIQAENNSVNFELQAEAGVDDCRFYPAFRITNYSSNHLPKYLRLYNASDTVMMIEGYGYNGYVNTTANELIIQLDTVLCADTKIFLDDDDDLAVTMSDFYAKSGDGKDTLFWRTESEKDNLGFFIYRRINPAFLDTLSREIDTTARDAELSPAAGMLQEKKITFDDTNWVKITPTMIPGVEGGTSAGPADYRKIDYGVENYILYDYRLEAISYDKTRDIYGPITVKPLPILPKRFYLFHNFPNPVVKYTNIRFDLPKETKVSLFIYNLQGRLVARVIRPDKKMKPGFYRILWNCTDDWGRKVAAGPYIYRLKAGKKYAKSRLMIVIK